MDKNQIEGAAQDVGGKLQDAVGGLTGDTATQLRGKADQVAGQAQHAYGKVADEVGNVIHEQPLAMLLSMLGLGLLFGFLFARR